VVLNQLATVIPESAQVRVPGVEDLRCLLVGQMQFAAQVCRAPVPLRILVQGLPQKGVGEGTLEGAENPEAPACRVSLGSWLLVPVVVFWDLRGNIGVPGTSANLEQ
jgi:hypothetical protein